jgi:hypothetical protein
MTPPSQGPPDPVLPGPVPLINQAALSPDRLAQLLDGAVQAVTTRAGTFDRIQHGVRRRRAVRRASAVLLGIAMIAGGGVTALAMAPAGAPARLGALAPVPATSAAYASVVPANAAQGQSRSPAISANEQAGAKAQAGANVHGGASTAAPSAGVPAPSAGDLSGLKSQPEVIGSADAAGNGLPEIFVLLDKGCCQQLWTIFRLVNGHLTQVTMAGKPVELAVGGTVMDSAGFSCGGSAHDLVTYGYRNESAGKFLATRATYRWAGARLVLVSRQQATIQAAAPSARLARYTGVSCGNLPQYAA